MSNHPAQSARYRLFVSTLTLCTAVASAQTSVLTYHNDNGRTGRYLDENLLAPSNVKPGLFGKRYALTLDGSVYAQPLYMSRVKIANKGLRNVLFVVTSHDSVYAFDADDLSSPAQPLWQVNFLDSNNNVTTVSQADVNCPVMPELGIGGTPVIDATAGTLYVIAETKESNQFVFRLHALDVTSGAERSGSPVEIHPPDFVPVAHKQRTDLLLSNNVVYSSWTGHCDFGTYHGWVMAHDSTTLNLLGAFNTTPNDSGASFWSGGAGPAAGADGNVYVVSANGDFDGNIAAARYDESVLKLSPAPQLEVTDLFTPFNRLNLDGLDLDLGSSGAVLLPDEAGTPAHPHVLFTSGKEGRLYLLDRQNLGGLQTDSDLQALTTLPASNQGTFGSAAYFNGAMYLQPANSPVMAWPVAGARLASTPSAKGSAISGPRGATPSISASGNENGIVWTLSEDASGTLHAYDATTLAELFNSTTRASDALGNYAEFSVPTVAGGKVFAGTYFGVTVYGELASATPSIAAVTNAANFSAAALSPGALVTVFGSNLAQLTASASSLPLPLSLGDVSVTINGVVAPLLFVSPQQINAQVPTSVAAGTAMVVVRSSGKPSTAASVTMNNAAPAIFPTSRGQDAAVNVGFSPGDTVSFYFTGQGAVDQIIDDGAAAPSTPLANVTSQISATIGGSAAPVLFAGLAPGYVGLAQINLTVPQLAPGSYPVVITIAGVASDPTQISIASQ